jgi:hypothetical protein
MVDGLSAYELQREKTIARNRQFLVALGLDQPALPTPRARSAAPKKRKPQGDPDAPARRSARVVPASSAGRASDDDDDDDDDDDLGFAAAAKKKSAAAKRVKPDEVIPDAAGAAGEACITVEAAKTGRSKCRRCLEQLPAAALRIGMESWMVGRQVTVFQHPACFWQGLSITNEASGRTKCKHTKTTFARGENRLSASAHTSTAHIKLAAAPSLLRPVYAALPESERPALDTIEGFETLDAVERRAFEVAMTRVVDPASSPADADNAPTPSQEEASAEEAAAPFQKNAKTVDRGSKKQPPAGKVSKAKGKVCWMFAGKQCYGTLLAGRETANMCYARTHKGNTKTLSKGGTYWWMLEQ